MTQQEREAQMGNGLQIAKEIYGNTSLMEKIYKLQSQIGKISKDKENPFFHSSYFDINILLDEVYPLIKEHGLVLLQPIRDGRVYSILIDKDTGEHEDSWIELPTSTKPQDLGSAITYYRRYTLQSLLSLRADDDDGNKASKNTSNGESNRNGSPTGNNDSDKEWLNATERNGALNKTGEATAHKLLNEETDWKTIYSKVKVSTKDRKAIEERVKELELEDTPF